MTHNELRYYVVDPDKFAKVKPCGADDIALLTRELCPCGVFGDDVVGYVTSDVDDYCSSIGSCKLCWESAANPDYVVIDRWHMFYDGAVGKTVAELSEIFPRVFNLHNEPPVAQISEDDLICLLRGEVK